MADQFMMYAVTTGFFVVFVAIIFGARAHRYSKGSIDSTDSNSSHSPIGGGSSS